MRNDQNGLIGGVVLIFIGIAALAQRLTDGNGNYLLLIIGIGLLVLFAATRNPGALIGGSIVTGLGTGIVLATTTSGAAGGGAVVGGLGLGFVGMWVLGRLFRVEETRGWPLVPGTILIAVASFLVAGDDGARLLGTIWPLGLIFGGVAAVTLGVLDRKRTATH